MVYIENIKTALLFFPLIAFLFTIPFMLIQYHKYGAINKFRTLIVYSFILYIITVYFLVILPLPTKEQLLNMQEIKPNLMPFKFVIDIIKTSPLVISDSSTYIKAITNDSVYTVLFNILMTIPFGMYLRYYYKCSLKKCTIITFFLSLFFELTQLTGLYFLYEKPYRCFDVDDLMMNTLGGVLGYYIMGITKKFLPTRDQIDKKTLECGKTVSGLRRITMFFLDTFLYIFIQILVSFFINNIYTKYITFTIYYIVIPYIWNGYTLGSKFLNVQLSFPNKTLFRLIIKRIVTIFHYVIFPFSIIYLTHFLHKMTTMNNYIMFIIYMFEILFILLWYIISTINILKNKTIFYDNISKVSFISTIKRNDTV